MSVYNKRIPQIPEYLSISEREIQAIIATEMTRYGFEFLRNRAKDNGHVQVDLMERQ